MTAAGAWFITPHAVRRYIERIRPHMSTTGADAGDDFVGLYDLRALAVEPLEAPTQFGATFNGRVISRHRSIATATRAESAFGRRVVRANGSGHHIPTTIRREDTSRASCDSAYETAIPLTDAEIDAWERARDRAGRQ